MDNFSKLLPVLGAIVAFLFAALLVLYIIRLLFGRRIRTPVGKKAGRRLDVVDVFDLDRERQLIIVRRDDKEHLLLIGGPNDLLVEGSISGEAGARVETSPARVGEARAPSQPAAGWPTPPENAPAGGPAPKPSAPGPLNLPPDLFAPAPSRPAPQETAAAPGPSPGPGPGPAPASPRPAAGPGLPPAPPRPSVPRPATPPFLARTQRLIQPRPEAEADPAPAAGPAAPPPGAVPAPLRPATPAAPAGGPPQPGAAPTPPRPMAPPPPPPPPMRPTAPPPAGARPPAPPPAPARPAAPPPPPPEKPVDVDPLESLEAEMARLLGRPENE